MKPFLTPTTAIKCPQFWGTGVCCIKRSVCKRIFLYNRPQMSLWGEFQQLIYLTDWENAASSPPPRFAHISPSHHIRSPGKMATDGTGRRTSCCAMHWFLNGSIGIWNEKNLHLRRSRAGQWMRIVLVSISSCMRYFGIPTSNSIIGSRGTCVQTCLLLSHNVLP